jgi:hypothetical protein
MNTGSARPGRTVYRLTFEIPVDMEAVEDTLPVPKRPSTAKHACGAGA